MGGRRFKRFKSLRGLKVGAVPVVVFATGTSGLRHAIRATPRREGKRFKSSRGLKGWRCRRVGGTFDARVTRREDQEGTMFRWRKPPAGGS